MNTDKLTMIGKEVKRGDRTGVITSFNPDYKACIAITWSDGSQEGWFDIDGTDGTKEKANRIKILQQ